MFSAWGPEGGREGGRERERERDALCPRGLRWALGTSAGPLRQRPERERERSREEKKSDGDKKMRPQAMAIPGYVHYPVTITLV